LPAPLSPKRPTTSDLPMKSDAWWDVGVPQISARPEVLAAYAEQLVGRERQRQGV
jgi:TPP-dependent trihydroxycyclohexane-1,2-dione (THcHDO) dehydratase